MPMHAPTSNAPRTVRPFAIARIGAQALWWATPAAFAALWWLASAQRWFPPQLVVPPERIASTLRVLIETGELRDNLLITLHRLALGFAIGATSGAAFGILLASSRLFSDYLRPTFDLLRQVPTLTLIPLLVLLIGVDEPLKLVVVGKAVFFPVALAAFAGVHDTPRDLVEMARHYGVGRVALLRDVLLPAALPPLLTGIRIALARAWLALVAVELLSADSGIGQMMELARQMLRLDVVLVDVAVIGLIGFALDRSIALVQRHALRWQAPAR
ncbi:ABC transporter permease [Burkholderia cenocepacia]|uniref:ABC transporter permease n=2 Tax=Burkholderia pseudomultivorans TaxID=1207504 RepID=A0A132EUL1_9BURK|nr:ABC transporter permease [Burkholderia pseudomultivorans]KWF08263.1 ABC transporter permease [Burkholderia pseudomultivorans]KWF59744.1 ABC transporter permease [Burkholderia pseudomultivorans]MBF5013054.1 ABC transporter permease subunit [Burkholderia pseudomultivorans]